jgi:N-methylhydantoinase A
MRSADALFFRELDLRYTGQGYELRTPLDDLTCNPLTRDSFPAIRARFDERHAHLHGHAAKERPVEIVSYRLRVRLCVPKYQPRPASSARAGDAVKGARQISVAGAVMEAAIYERDRLDAGVMVRAPAIVEQFDATTLVPPPWTGRVDAYGNLVLTRT